MVSIMSSAQLAAILEVDDTWNTPCITSFQLSKILIAEIGVGNRKAEWFMRDCLAIYDSPHSQYLMSSLISQYIG